MLFTHKTISELKTIIKIDKNPSLLRNNTTNETYVMIQPFINVEGVNLDEFYKELQDNGFDLQFLNFSYEIILEIEKGQETKQLTYAASNGKFQTYILWNVGVVN